MNSLLISFLFSVQLTVGDLLSDGLEKIVEFFDPKPPVFERKINQKHQFEIDQCTLTYNGKELKFGQTIDDWVEIMGPYNTKTFDSGPFVWQEMGVRIYTRRKTGKISTIMFLYGRQPRDFSLEIELETQRALGGEKKVQEYLEHERTFYPKYFFVDSILVDGILMDDQFYLDKYHIPKELNQARIEKGLTPFHKSMWKWNWVVLKNCDDQEYALTVEVNKKNLGKLVSIEFRINQTNFE